MSPPYSTLRGGAASSFILRKAAMDDVPALHKLIERSVRTLQANDYTPEQMNGALGYTLGLDTQLIKDGTYFVATPADDPITIAGCGGWSFRRTTFGSDSGPNRELTTLDPATESAKIRAIFIDPAFARRGLGTLILKHCEEAAKAAGFRSFVMGSTVTGVPLYTLRGYKETSRIEVPLPNDASLPIVYMSKAAD